MEAALVSPSSACMRSIMAARPDGILSAARSLGRRARRRPAPACGQKVQNWCSIEFSQTRLTTVTERVWFFAPGAGDALFELRRVPGQVDVDHAARDLQVEPDAAAVGREEQAAGGILLEADDLGAAALLRHRAGVPGGLDADLRREFAHQSSIRSHSENTMILRSGSSSRSSKMPSSSSSLGLTRQSGSRIAGVSQIMRMQAEQHLQALEFLWRQRAALRRSRRAAARFVLGVAGACSSAMGTK